MPKPHERIDFSRPVAMLVGDANYTHLYYPDGSRELSAKTLKLIITLYPDLTRIHKRYAVDLQYVVGCNLRVANDSTVTIRIGEKDYKLDVPRRRVKALRDLLKTKS